MLGSSCREASRRIAGCRQRLGPLVLVALALLAAHAFSGGAAGGVRQAEAAAGTCVDGVQSTGALYRVCKPSGFYSGMLFIYVHGGVSATEPNLILFDPQIGGTPMSDVFMSQGFAFATSSFRKNGLAVLEGIDDIKDLVDVFAATYGAPAKVFLFGVSEGGLITTLSLERYPDVYDGGIAACTARESAMIQYIGDVRVLFEWYFPNGLSGNTAIIPESIYMKWEDKYVPRILEALASHPDTMHELMAIAGVPLQIDGTPEEDLQADALAVGTLVLGQALGGEETVVELKGQPYDNTDTMYTGSSDDEMLNRVVRRYAADPSAIAELQKYEPTGYVQRPLVELHTLRDYIAPYFTAVDYAQKVAAQEAMHGVDLPFIHIPVNRDGHCTFNADEYTQALNALFYLVATNPGP